MLFGFVGMPHISGETLLLSLWVACNSLAMYGMPHWHPRRDNQLPLAHLAEKRRRRVDDHVELHSTLRTAGETLVREQEDDSIASLQRAKWVAAAEDRRRPPGSIRACGRPRPGQDLRPAPTAIESPNLRHRHPH